MANPEDQHDQTIIFDFADEPVWSHSILPKFPEARTVLAIAAVKVRLIMINFMELGHAPVRWRVLFDAWTVACTAVILIMYLR